MELIDIGINLMHKQYNKDRQEVIKEAKKEGVTRDIITGSSVSSSISAEKYASKYPNTLYSTAGVHPHDAKTCDDRTIDTLRNLAKSDVVVAIGECGLDYNRNFSPANIQRKWFEKQVKLAEELKMPLFLHDRESYDDFAKILRKHRKISQKSVVHCFTGTKYEAEDYLDLGCYIGITGWICDSRRNKELLKAIRIIPPEKLMIETDGPFLLPRDFNQRPKNNRNEPKYLPHILKRIAKEIDMDYEKLATIVTKNTEDFFGI